MARHSRNNTVVEYGAREMMKGKTPSTAAKSTVKKLNGHSNFLIDTTSATDIDESELEEVLWDRLVDYTIKGIDKMRAGKEHFALDSAVQHFTQTRFKKVRPELKRRVVERLGHDPFTQDDAG